MNRIKDYAQFLRTLEVIPDGIVLIDESGKIVFVNQRLVSMFGYTKEELLKNRIEILLPENYRGKHVALRQNYHARPYTRAMKPDADLMGQTKDGKTLCLDIMLSPVKTSHETCVLAAIRDISQYKKMEKSLLQSKKRLERKVRELNSFFYNTSHNLKGPISSAMGLVNLGIMESREEISQTYFEYISKTLTTLETTFNKISFLSKLDGRQLNPTVIDFDRVIRGTYDKLKDTEGFERMSINVTNMLHSTFYSDAEVIEAIFYHLLENSIKYQDVKNEKPLISIHLSERSSGIQIDICDNGIGIPEQFRKRAFNMFFRGSERSVGSGMGLYVVKKAVTRLNGKIKIVDQIHKGTSFKITIPNQESGALF